VIPDHGGDIWCFLQGTEYEVTPLQEVKVKVTQLEQCLSAYGDIRRTLN